MIFQITSGADPSHEMYADKSIVALIDHDSKPIACSDGLTRFIDRGYTTYRARLKFTNDTLLIDDFLVWLQDNQSAEDLTVSVGDGEEIFGPHLDYSAALSIVISSPGAASRINLIQSSFELEITLKVSDKSVIPDLLPGLTPTLDNLKYPTNYESSGIAKHAYLSLMDSEQTPVSKKSTKNKFSGSFTLLNEEMAEALAYWDTNRHGEFPTPSLLAPLFTPARPSSTLRIARIAEVRRINRLQWSATISFVIGSY